MKWKLWFFIQSTLIIIVNLIVMHCNENKEITKEIRIMKWSLTLNAFSLCKIYEQIFTLGKLVLVDSWRRHSTPSFSSLYESWKYILWFQNPPVYFNAFQQCRQKVPLQRCEALRNGGPTKSYHIWYSSFQVKTLERCERYHAELKLWNYWIT